MVDSGIKVCNTSHPYIADLESRKYDYIIFKIKKVGAVDKVVHDVLKEAGSCKKECDEAGIDLKGVPPVWHVFSEAMQKDHDVAFGCCYVHFTTKEGCMKDKLAFVYWCTDSAKIKDKMIYSSSKIPTSRKIKSVSHVFQCADKDDISYQEIVEVVSKGDHNYKKCGGH